MNTEIIQELKSMGACSEAVVWASQFSSPQEVWDKCGKSAWMLWYLRKKGEIEKKIFVQLAIEFAERVLDKFEEKYSQERPRLAIEAAKKWVLEQSEENRIAAAYAAAYASAAVDAADAADAAAAATAYAAASAAASAAYASAAYAAYAAYAASAAAYATSAAERKIQCSIIRKYIPLQDGLRKHKKALRN